MPGAVKRYDYDSNFSFQPCHYTSGGRRFMNNEHRPIRSEFKIGYREHQLIHNPVCIPFATSTSPTEYIHATQTLEIQHTHPSIATTGPFALFALEERRTPLEQVHLSRLRPILREPSPIPEQPHHVVLGALDPLVQLVADARRGRVPLQIFLDVLGRGFASERV